jgi:hypothetical protein
MSPHCWSPFRSAWLFGQLTAPPPPLSPSQLQVVVWDAVIFDNHA